MKIRFALVLSASLASVFVAGSVADAEAPADPELKVQTPRAKLPAADAARISAALKAKNAKASAADKEKYTAKLENKKLAGTPAVVDGKKVTKGSVTVRGLGEKRKPHAIAFEAKQALKKGGYNLTVVVTDTEEAGSPVVTTLLIDEELKKISFQPQGATAVNVQLTAKGTFDVDGVVYPNGEDAAVAVAVHPSMQKLTKEGWSGFVHAFSTLEPVSKYTSVYYGGYSVFYGGLYTSIGLTCFSCSYYYSYR
jgi:hypothetical protein